jgi:adenylate kinase
MSYQAILLTGAPASGKSTLAANLQSHIQPLKVISFSDLIMAQKRSIYPNLSHDELRTLSAKLVSPQDVFSLDSVIAENLVAWLNGTNVIIDSHAVTHETYGVRITAFNRNTLERMNLSAVVVLYCPPKELLRRIKQQSGGRQINTITQADRIQQLQVSLAQMYGILCGCPVFVVDSSIRSEELMDIVMRILQKSRVFLDIK